MKVLYVTSWRSVFPRRPPSQEAHKDPQRRLPALRKLGPARPDRGASSAAEGPKGLTYFWSSSSSVASVSFSYSSWPPFLLSSSLGHASSVGLVAPCPTSLHPPALVALAFSSTDRPTSPPALRPPADASRAWSLRVHFTSLLNPSV